MDHACFGVSDDTRSLQDELPIALSGALCDEQTAYLLRFPFGARWLRALAAAVFDLFEVRPSRSTLDAALAALTLVRR